MPGAVVELKYFNSFVLKKTAVNSTDEIVWNGSFGIPSNVKGGYPVVSGSTNDVSNWAIEESRVRGGYNNTSTDYGAKAYLVEEDPASTIRFNSLIYSGIFNSRTGINNSNVFSVADDITKSADPYNGSIQKLYAEDTNLIIFQERKVSKALIDKDAIYTAEGNAAVTASNLVIGVIQPYAGKFGISKNPESFAVYGFNKYFADKNNNAILRLSGGIEEISRFGMIDYFRDELNSIGVNGKIRGGWDIYNDHYVVSTQNDSNNNYNTVSWDDSVQGWTSFYNYKPTQMFSLGSKFYSTGKKQRYTSFWSESDADSLFVHYDPDVNRSFFYNRNYPASVTFVFNPNPSSVKNFKTISYEGFNGWKLNSLRSDTTGGSLIPQTSAWTNTFDTTGQVLSYYEGEYAYAADGSVITRANYASNPPTGFGNANPPVPRYYAGFNRKENRYVANLVNFSQAAPSEILFGQDLSGIKGYFVVGKISTDGDYENTTTYTNTATNPGGEKQLFAVGADYTNTNGY